MPYGTKSGAVNMKTYKLVLLLFMLALRISLNNSSLCLALVKHKVRNSIGFVSGKALGMRSFFTDFLCLFGCSICPPLLMLLFQPKLHRDWDKYSNGDREMSTPQNHRVDLAVSWERVPKWEHLRDEETTIAGSFHASQISTS